MINIRRVINYAWQMLKAQGGSYPQIENMIRQAELDAGHYEWVLSNAQHRVQRTAFGAFCGGVVFGMFIMFVLGALL